MPKYEEAEIPKSWVNTTLYDVCQKIQDGNYGGSYPKKDEWVEDGIPFITGAALGENCILEHKLRFVDEEKNSTLTKAQVTSNDVIFPNRGATDSQLNGKSNLAYLLGDRFSNANINPQITLLRSTDAVVPSYLKNYVCSPYFLDSLKEVTKGSALTFINLTKTKEIEIPLAPLSEQKRIVEKLDSLLAQVDTIQQRLNNLPDIIKRFRQSVLAAAVSGKLTEQWRGDSGYQESNFGFDIPDTWSLCEIQNVAEVKGGKRLPKGEELVPEDTGYRYVRAGQLKNGTIINGDMARNSQMYLKAHVQEQIKRYIVKKGDAYITIVGASIGDAGVVPNNYDGANLTENAAKICEFSKPMNSDFIGFWLRSQLIQQLIRLEIKSGAQGKLALKRIKTLPIPDISIEEQTEIVRLVEQYFALADTLEKNLANAKQRVDNLTQSILAKAFRGELVPQDPNDEPADKLLARIKAARLEAEKLEKAAKKAAKASKK